MESDSKDFGEAGLKFFGKVTASVSHEIRNVLAIINENAGLLEDLVLKSEKGMPLETERLKTLSGKLRNHVKRGDEIVGNMNRFAHSIDDPLRTVEVTEILDLMIKLAGRTAAGKKIVLEQIPCETPVVLTTRPFVFEHVIWLCLNAVIDAAVAPTTIQFVPEAREGGVQVSLICPDEVIPAARQQDLLEGEPEHLMKGLGADWEFLPEAGAVILRFPNSIS